MLALLSNVSPIKQNPFSRNSATHLLCTIAYARPIQGKKEGIVLFNDTLSTFIYMVNDHSDTDRGNLLPHMGYSFWLTARVLLYAPSHRKEKKLNGSTTNDYSDDPSHDERALLPWRFLGPYKPELYIN